MNRAAPALIFIAPVKLRIIQITHQYLQLHHPALLVRIQILGQTLRADEEVALRAAQEALLARRWFNFPGACMRREPEPQLCVAFHKVRLSTHRHHLTRSHLIMPSAPPQLPSFKNRQPRTGRGQARLARAGEGSSHIYFALNTLVKTGFVPKLLSRALAGPISACGHPEQVTRGATTRHARRKPRRPPHSEHLTNAAVFSLEAK